jgi:hypothetical protein
MDLMILKKKIDGYRVANGCIKNVSPELLLELRQTWEHYTGSSEAFRAELGIKTGTLRNLLIESKKLNHVIASAGAVGLAVENGVEPNQPTGEEAAQSSGNGLPGSALELVFDQGTKVLRFPNVDLLIDFLRKTA